MRFGNNATKPVFNERSQCDAFAGRNFTSLAQQ